MMLPSVTLTEATGFGRLYEEPGSVSAAHALAPGPPTRAVAALSGRGFGAALLRPFAAGRSAGMSAVRLDLRAEGEHGKVD